MGTNEGSGFSSGLTQLGHSFFRGHPSLPQSPSLPQEPEPPTIRECPITEVGDRAKRESRGWRNLGLKLEDKISTEAGRGDRTCPVGPQLPPRELYTRTSHESGKEVGLLSGVIVRADPEAGSDGAPSPPAQPHTPPKEEALGAPVTQT